VRTYGQYCSIARALDVIGDRWNLLIVRELLLRGPCRYTDLLEGLPGVATNLLADRLRELEQAGVIAREEAPAPVAATVFSLTQRGRELAPTLRELGRWGAPLMAEPAGGDAFRSRWLQLPVELFLGDQTPDQPPSAIEVRCGDDPIVIHTSAGAVHTAPGPAEEPDLVIDGAPLLVLGVLTGRLGLEEARGRGLRCEGDLAALARIQPVSARASSPDTATRAT
jgi:DNA-binding HxlR family transcriptional regulator